MDHKLPPEIGMNERLASPTRPRHALYALIGVVGLFGVPTLADLVVSVAQAQTDSEAPGLKREGDAVIIPEGSPYRKRVVSAPVEARQIAQTLKLPAIVEADPSRTFNILPPLGGRVAQLSVHLGDRVVAGQTLVTIESGDLAQAYADADKAHAQQALTRRALARAAGLIKAGGGAVKDYESAQNDAAQADAEATRAESRLKTLLGGATLNGPRQLTITAPAAGSVTSLQVSAGSYINDPTQTMLTISNLETVFITAQLPETDTRLVAAGQPVDIVFNAYPGEKFHGSVLFVSDVMEPDTRRTKIRVAFANPDMRFKPNMFATVTTHLPKLTALVVPNSALLMNNDATTVFVEKAPWTFVRRPVQPGTDHDGATAITSGLQPGERVVISGGILLND